MAKTVKIKVLRVPQVSSDGSIGDNVTTSIGDDEEISGIAWTRKEMISTEGDLYYEKITHIALVIKEV